MKTRQEIERKVNDLMDEVDKLKERYRQGYSLVSDEITAAIVAGTHIPTSADQITYALEEKMAHIDVLLWVLDDKSGKEI